MTATERDPKARLDPDGRRGASLGRLAKRANKKRLAVVLVGTVVALAAVIGLIVFLVGREPGPTLEDLAFDAMRQSLVDAEELAAQNGTDRLDLAVLRATLDTALDGYTIDVASTDDTTQVGVTAKEINGPTCLLVWSAVGGPRTALVEDPNLFCTGRLALANLR